MKKFSTFILSLLMGLNVFAQNQVLKAIPSAEVKNFKVAETQLKQQSSAKADYRNYLENEAFYTTYDFQSNSYIGNRMYQLNDGSVGVVATMSNEEYDESFPDRGTGYNFYKEGNIYASNDIPQVREEANATGTDLSTRWPSIAPYGTEGEILVNHANGLQYYIREKAGEGVWDGPHAIPNPENIDEVVKGEGNALAWARIVTTGENNDVLHVFANASGEENYASYYLRSEDLQNWDIQFSPLEMDSLHINCYAADDYVVSANGNNIAVVYCNGFSEHVMIYISHDAGLTWESRMIWESPVVYIEDEWFDESNEDFSYEDLYGPTHASVAIGNDGVAHVALSVSMYALKPGGYYSLYWGLITDGIAYWNSTYETPLRSVYDDDLRHALRMWTPDPEDEAMMFLDFTNFCALLPPHTEEWFSYFEASKQYHGSEGTPGDYLWSFGLSAYPAIAVDPAGNLAIAYSAPDVNRDELYYDANGNPYYYRSIFVNYKPVDSATWAQMPVLTPTNMYSASAHSQSECTYVSAVSNPKNVNEFWFSCMTDDTPGFHTGVSGASQDHITTGTINVFKFTPTEEYEVEDPLPEEPENYWNPDPSLYANNMTVITTIEIDGEEQSSLDLELGAFCNGELRGSGKLQYVGAPANRYECFLMVYGNSGDNITFKLYDHATKTELDLRTNESVTFEVNGAVGDVINPYTINFKSKYWFPDQTLYPNNMTVISTIAIDGVEQYNTDLELGAFCGDEVRGSGKLQYVGSPANRYECFLMVYGNAGDNITFKLYDHATETVSDLKTNQSVTFEVNGAVGDVINPYAINFTSTIVHNQELKSGWNWYSTYIVNEGAEGLANLENAVGTNGIQIKNQSKFVNQAGGNWYGTLTETSVEDMFMIQMSSATNVALEGYEVNPAEHPITLGTNWKWISYPLSTEMSVEEAFASANPSNGDYVKSQKGFAQYYEGLGWSGTLKTMTPGLGYMYQNVSGSAKTLVYPTVSMSKSVAASSMAASEVELHWNPDVSLYPDNMTLITTVEIEGVEQATEDIEIGAFCGDEVRGSGRLQYVGAPADRYECFLLFVGKAGDEITFRIYDHATQSELELETDMTVEFAAHGTLGDVVNPETINFTAGEPVQAVANPIEGGTVEGTGSYQVGETATLKAIENDGYVFLNWTEDGEVVSDEMEYSFVVERATNLVANFAPVYWIPDETLHPNNMSLITTIVIDGVEQDNHRLEIGAFCGEELRGHGRLQYIAAPADKHEAFITIYGEDSDSITFKLYDHATASILDLRTDYSLSFSVNGTVGTVIEPNVMNFTSRVAIEATANPAEGGTVTGAGNYHIGDEVSLTATANEKYAFINWTVEGEEVYTENNYTFTVEGARNLVANFAIIATPSNLKAEATSISEINLTWDTVENALSYNVYQGDELLANVTETTLTVDGLEPNTEYCFSVTAVRNETESDKSEEACAKTFDLPITTPSNLKAEATSISEINLTWDTVENALSYNVYQGAELLANVTETTLTVDNLEPNTEYCFSVAAVRNETESDKSEEACAKTFGDGIEELASSINIYPNPVDNELFLATELRVEEIAIYDVYGRTTTVYGLQTTDFVHSIDVADLEAGVYFVNIKTENGNIVKRFVKK